jgi:hypothetical protein
MTVFIQKGDTPMSYRQAVKRGLRHFEAEKVYWQREQGIVESDPGYIAWAAQWVLDNQVNAENNQFNHMLSNYRAALSRLEKYRLVEGYPEQTSEEPTGTFDEEGNEIMDVTVVPAIEPLPAQVEETTYDDEGNVTGTIMVDNPEIVRDDAERAAAQGVIAVTPDEVKSFPAS